MERADAGKPRGGSRLRRVGMTGTESVEQLVRQREAYARGIAATSCMRRSGETRTVLAKRDADLLVMEQWIADVDARLVAVRGE